LNPAGRNRNNKNLRSKGGKMRLYAIIPEKIAVPRRSKKRRKRRGGKGGVWLFARDQRVLETFPFWARIDRRGWGTEG